MQINNDIYNEVLRESLANSSLALVFWVVENDGISILDWNPVSESIFGWTKEEVVGRDFFDIIVPESEKLTVETVISMLKENRYPNTSINNCLTKSGKEKIIRWFNTPTKDIHNGKIFVVSLAEDITEKEEMKNQVEVSISRFQLLFNKMKSGFAYHEIILDSNKRPVDYRFLEINPEFERLTGLKAEDIIGKTAKEVLPEIEDYWIERYGKVALTGESTEFESYSSALDRYYSIRAFSPEKNKFAVIFNDITAARKAEDNLRLSLEKQILYEKAMNDSMLKHKYLFQNSSDGIIYINNKGVVIDYNQAFETITGINLKETDNKPVYELSRNIIHEDGSPYEFEELPGRKALRSGKIEGSVIAGIVNNKYNKVVWVKETAIPIFRENENEPYQINLVYTDVTEIKEAKDKLQNQKRFYESIIEKMQEAIIVCDSNDSINYVNKSFLEFSGASTDDVIGKNIIKDFSSFLPVSFFKDYIKAKDNNTTIKSEKHSVLLPSGKFAYMSGWIIPIIVKNKCESIIITFEDVTEKLISELEIKRLNRVYSIISNINKSIVREKQIEKLLNRICHIAVENGGFILTWIGLKDDETSKVILKAINSKVSINRHIGDMISIDELPINCQNVLNGSGFIVNNDIETDDVSTNDFFLSQSSICCSSATLPLKINEKVIGFIELYSEEVGFFDLEEQELLSELASDISFAIEHNNIERERIAAENKIKELNRDLEIILQNSPAGIISVSIEGIILSWNKSAELILGWKTEEAIGLNVFDIFLEFNNKIKILKELFLNHNKIYNFEMPFINKEGTPITLNVSAAPVINDKNEIVAAIAIIFDITEQKLSEEALLESERRLSELLQNIELIALNLDINGLITNCNDFLLKLTGWTRNEIIGKNWFEYFLPDNIRSQLEPQFKDFIINKQLPAHYENEIIAKDGSKILINWNNTYYTDDYGRIIGTLSIGEDITAKRAAEDEIKKINIELEQKVYDKTKELERALVELEYENEERKRTAEILKITSKDLANSLEKEKELNEMKSKFIDLIIRKYRTPLTIILSSSTLALKFSNSNEIEKLIKHITKIKTTTKEMMRLLDDILIIGKNENDNNIPNFDIVDLNELYYEVIDSLPVSDENTHKFEYNSDGQLISIHTDKLLLKKILTNIISNAINYSDTGTLIKTNVADLGQRIEISIQDQGVGISLEEQKYLFDTFFRGDNVGETFGAGLGLSIVKKLIEILKGSIEVKSEVGIGSTFIITLPK